MSSSATACDESTKNNLYRLVPRGQLKKKYGLPILGGRPAIGSGCPYEHLIEAELELGRQGHRLCFCGRKESCRNKNDHCRHVC